MQKFLVRVLLLLLAWPSTLLFAQGSISGSVKGIVTDTQGAVIAGAVVTVTGPALLKPKSQITVSGGIYLIEDLPPGDYQLTCSMPGSKAFAQNGIALTASFVATINIPLAVGDAAEPSPLPAPIPLWTCKVPRRRLPLTRSCWLIAPAATIRGLRLRKPPALRPAPSMSAETTAISNRRNRYTEARRRSRHMSSTVFRWRLPAAPRLTNDTNVPLWETLKVVDRLEKLGTPFDMAFYPGEIHSSDAPLCFATLSDAARHSSTST